MFSSLYSIIQLADYSLIPQRSLDRGTGEVLLYPVNGQKQKDNGICWSTLHCTLWADATPATEALLVHFPTVEQHSQLERDLGNVATSLLCRSM